MLQINASKSKILLFNNSRSFDFPPELAFSNGEILESISHTKLLGIIVSTDLKWHLNTHYIFKRAMSKMWLLRRLKRLDFEPQLICDYYIKEVRVLAEYCAVVWNSSLTQFEVRELETIQKIALKIILRSQYLNYEHARNILSKFNKLFFFIIKIFLIMNSRTPIYLLFMAIIIKYI